MGWNGENIKLEDESYFSTINGLWQGKTPPLIKAGVIRNTNFTESGRIDFSNIAWLEVEQKKFSTRQLIPGDIIIERSGGGPNQPVGRVVFFNRKDGKFSFSNFTSTIRVKDRTKYEPKFVFYSLLHLYQSGQTEDIQRRTTGIRNLDFGSYKARADFPEISIQEQCKIVSVLDLLQRALDHQERLILKTAELKKNLLHQLFTQGLRGELQKQTEIGPVPESWDVRTIGEIAKTRTGGTPARDNIKYWENGTIPWVKTGEINFGVINSTNEKITDDGLTNSAAKIFPKGTLLVAMYGQGITRGRVGILGIEAATNQACAAIIPHSEAQVSSLFIFYFIEYHYENIRKLGHGANQKNMNAALVRGFTIAFPKADEQKETINILSRVDAKLLLINRKQNLLSALFRTLLRQLMTGTKRVDTLPLNKIIDSGCDS